LSKSKESSKPVETDEARRARLEFLKQQIESGKYRFSDGALARVLMDHMEKKDTPPEE
jgi:anti-sigma28 factor (negative regulator of flagellin synthesis)